MGLSEPFSRSVSTFTTRFGLPCDCVTRGPSIEGAGESVLGVSKTLGASWFDELSVMTGSTVMPLTFLSV